MSICEITIWVDEALGSWLSTQAHRSGSLRHRYVEKVLAQLMEDQLSENREEEVSESFCKPIEPI